jgi:integrase
VAAELERHLSEYVAADNASPMFTGPQGGILRRPGFNVVWKQARVAVGREDLHLHDLRHFANTLAASAGASTRELMARLGHASPAAALRYQHATAERDRLIAERMGELVTGRAANGAPALRVLPGG